MLRSLIGEVEIAIGKYTYSSFNADARLKEMQ